MESYETAKLYDLEDEFFEILALTEGRDFKENHFQESITHIKVPKEKVRN